MIIQKDDGFYVMSEDKTKSLGGPYSSYEQASKRLQQVHYFKHQDAKKRFSKEAMFTIGLQSFYKSAESDDIQNSIVSAVQSSRIGKDLKILYYEALLKQKEKLEKEQSAMLSQLTPEQKKQMYMQLLSKYAQMRDPYVGLEQEASQPGGVTVPVTDKFIKRLEHIKDSNKGKTFIPSGDGSPDIMTGESGHLKYFDGKFKI